jgi:fatty acid desaturase
VQSISLAGIDDAPEQTALSLEAGMRAYARLKARVHAAGIIDRCYSYYAPLILVVFLGYLGSAAAIYVLDDYLLLTVACLSFTAFSVQMGGLMHDSGHRAVFRSRRLNDILGVVCSLMMGLVFDNWRTRHNAHHAFSNMQGKDPDAEIPFIATSRAAYVSKSAVQRLAARYQAFYYYPLGAIVSFSNRLGTLSYFINSGSNGTPVRFIAWVVPVSVLFVLPFVLFSPAKALFVMSLVHVTTGIYLANCFAPNHKGMPTVESGDKMSFLEQQVMTSRNVRGGRLIDVVLVGLNYQVEHHLFPSCPRNKLHSITPYLIETCDELGLQFVEKGIIETNRDILRALRRAPAGRA